MRNEHKFTLSFRIGALKVFELHIKVSTRAGMWIWGVQPKQPPIATCNLTWRINLSTLKSAVSVVTSFSPPTLLDDSLVVQVNMIPMDEDDAPEASTESAFQIALSKWRDIDLTTLQSQLDKQGMEIIESQKDFLVERKELSTKTKLFRKLPDDEKLVQVMSLLKGSPILEEG